MEGRFLLDVVVRESTSILQLLAGEDQPLLVRWDTLLVLQETVSNSNKEGASAILPEFWL